MKYAILMLLLLSALTLGACSKTHSAQITDSAQELEQVLRVNLDNTDALLAALDDYILKYQPLWDRNEHIFEVKTQEEIDREINTQAAKLREAYLNILNLDLEIQDRLRNDPDKLKAYQERVRKLGKSAQ